MNKILTMQDLSCVGQCSLTVALPILSAYGLETCVLPTAILSNHTMFPRWSYLDLSDELDNIFREWKENDFRFDAFLLGYLGKTSLMSLAERCFDEFSATNAKIVIDPVFGDNGKLYGGFDLSYVEGMRKLIRRADIILPNVTEACFLTETPYTEAYDASFVISLEEKLKKITNATIVITGAELGKDIAEVIYENNSGDVLLHEKLPVKKHGTGDIFASVFTANLLGGKDLRTSSNLAAKFVADCIRATDKEHFYGVKFEKILKQNSNL